MSANLFSLEGKVALVTGSTRGIGNAIVEHFIEAGAACMLCGEDARSVTDSLNEFRGQGSGLAGQRCDVSSAEDQQALIEATLNTFGRLDILVCNAGVSGQAGPIEQIDEQDYRRVFDINLHSMVQLCNFAYPHLKLSGGSIILLSSISALRGNANINAYALAKAGVSQLARNLAVQWGPANIRTNAIAPGLIRTGFSELLMQDAEFMRRRLQMTPLRRVGEMHEIAGTAVFLASPAGAFVNGQTLVVDGGTSVTDGS